MPWKESNVINQRTEFALKALQEGVNFSGLCQEYGISRKTGYKWLERYRQEGAHGLQDGSRRPQASPRKLGEDEILRIVRLHERHSAWGPKKIRELYARQYDNKPSLSTFKRVFERAGWTRKRPRRRSSDAGRLCTQRKASKPNDVWTVDFKGWWHTNDGSRCEPLTVRDEHSRYILEIRAMASARTEAVREVFEKLFERHGLPQAIRSDNGTPFAAASSLLGLSRLSTWWVALGIDLERGRPGKPQDNGGHERMHRDICEQLQSCARQDLEQQQASFDIWRQTFNEERPHEALGMKTPAQVYQNSQRPYEGTPADLIYEGMLTRRVHKTGTVHFENGVYRLSTSLGGWSVGIHPTGNGRYQVYFAELRLGELDINEKAFFPSSGGGEENKQQAS